jgi:hypothetical protein
MRQRVADLPSRLNERTNKMALRLANALELYIHRSSSVSPMRLFARWKDPSNGMIDDGVVSELQAAS